MGLEPLFSSFIADKTNLAKRSSVPGLGLIEFHAGRVKTVIFPVQLERADPSGANQHWHPLANHEQYRNLRESRIVLAVIDA